MAIGSGGTWTFVVIVFYLGVLLLIAAAAFFLGSLTVPALVCCGAGGVLMGYLLEAS